MTFEKHPNLTSEGEETDTDCKLNSESIDNDFSVTSLLLKPCDN